MLTFNYIDIENTLVCLWLGNACDGRSSDDLKDMPTERIGRGPRSGCFFFWQARHILQKADMAVKVCSRDTSHDELRSQVPEVHSIL